MYKGLKTLQKQTMFVDDFTEKVYGVFDSCKKFFRLPGDNRIMLFEIPGKEKQYAIFLLTILEYSMIHIDRIVICHENILDKQINGLCY